MNFLNWGKQWVTLKKKHGNETSVNTLEMEYGDANVHPYKHSTEDLGRINGQGKIT